MRDHFEKQDRNYKKTNEQLKLDLMNISEKAIDTVGFSLFQYLKTVSIVDSYRWNL